ncbi:MAG: hypothetical protein Kow0042_20490 [Calditrichia bacterium]
MKKRSGKTFLIGFLILFFFVAILIILYSYTPLVDQAIVELVNGLVARGVEIDIGRIEGNLLGSVRLIDLRIKTAGFAVDCPQVSLSFSSLDLLKGKINVDQLTLLNPTLTLYWPPGATSEKEQSPSELSPDSLISSIDLSGLPQLNIKFLRIKDGVVQSLRDSINRHVEQISMEGGCAIRSEEVNVRVKYVKGFWVDEDLRLKEASFQLLGSRQRVTLNQFRALLPGAEIFAHGEIELMPRIRFFIFTDTCQVSVPLIRQFLTKFPFQQGELKFIGHYIGDFRTFQGSFIFGGEMDSLQFKKIQTDYHYGQKALHLKSLKIETNFGRGEGSVTVALQGNNELSFRFQAVNLKKAGLTEKPTHLEGDLHLSFTHWDLSRISGQGRATLREIRYGNLHFDRLFLNLSAKSGNWELKKGSYLIVEENSQFFVEGRMSSDLSLYVELYTDENNLDTLDRRLDLNLMGGVGSMHVILTGKPENPDIFGYFLLDSLIVRDIRSYGIEGRFEIIGLTRERIGYFQLELSSGRISDILITDGALALKMNQNRVTIDSISFYNEENYITMGGTVDQTDDRFEIELDEFKIRYENYLVFAPDTLQALFQNDSLIFEDFVLQAPDGGELEIRGILDLEGNSELGVYLKNIQLFTFNQFIPWSYKLEGLAEISLILTGNPGRPDIESDLVLDHLRLDGDTLGGLTAKLIYSNERIGIDHFRFKKDPASYVSMSGSFQIPNRAAKKSGSRSKIREDSLLVEFRGIALQDYPFFKQLTFPVKGRFGGEIQLYGSVYSPVGKYRLKGENFQVQDYFFPEIQIDGRLSPAQILMDYADVNFMGTRILANGYKTIRWDIEHPDQLFADKGFALLVKIEDDSLNFLSLFTEEADILTGDIRLQARLGGTIDHPLLMGGDLSISDGTLYLSRLENPVTNLTLQGTVKNQILHIDKGEAQLESEAEHRNLFQKAVNFVLAPVRKLVFGEDKKSSVKLEGTIDFSIMDRPRFDLAVDARNVFVNYYLENLKVGFTSRNLHIFGRDTVNIQGDVFVDRGEIVLDLEESEKNLLLSPTIREMPPFTTYALNIEIPGNFYIRSEANFNAFDLQIAGNVLLRQRPKELLEIYGTLEVLGGKYYQFEEFNITRGEVKFVNPEELPQPDIWAEKRKYGYIFELHVGGTLNDPVKKIRIIDLQTLQDVTYLYPDTKDQMALLLFGVTFNELSGNAFLEKGQDFLNQALISRIEREARRFIGLDQVRLESVDSRSQRLSQPSEYHQLSLGKYLTPKLYFEYKAQLNSAGLPGLGDIPTPELSWESGNQIYLEYRINRNWSISTYYEKQEHDKIKIDINWRLNF